jgi:hypothetical protein
MALPELEQSGFHCLRRCSMPRHRLSVDAQLAILQPRRPPKADGLCPGSRDPRARGITQTTSSRAEPISTLDSYQHVLWGKGDSVRDAPPRGAYFDSGNRSAGSAAILPISPVLDAVSVTTTPTLAPTCMR